MVTLLYVDTAARYLALTQLLGRSSNGRFMFDWVFNSPELVKAITSPQWVFSYWIPRVIVLRSEHARGHLAQLLSGYWLVCLYAAPQPTPFEILNVLTSNVCRTRYEYY